MHPGKWAREALAVGLALCSATAQAAPTAWEARGTVDQFEPGGPGDIDLSIGIGSPLRAVMNFDTATVLTQVQPGRFQNFTAPGVSLVAYVGGFGPFVVAPGSGTIIVRDRASFTEGGVTRIVDGYSFSARATDSSDGVTTSFLVVFRGEDDLLVNPNTLLPLDPPAALTDPARLAALQTAAFQVCRWDANANPPPDQGGQCNRGFVSGRLNSVAAPAVGANWFLSARDCQYIDSNTAPADSRPHDCVLVSSAGNLLPGVGRLADNFVSLGLDGFDLVFDPRSPFTGPSNGQPLGFVNGIVSFTGPAGLPVLRGASLPSDISRTNANLLAFQRYEYKGPATPMPLVVDLTYAIADNSVDPASANEVGLTAGGATLSAVLAIVDASKVSLQQVAATPFNSIACGREGVVDPDPFNPNPLQDWPAGAVLGSVSYSSPPGQKDASASTVLEVRGCADPSGPVQLQADQSFIVASSMQTPARGKWTLNSSAPSANGFVDSRNTMRVTFDPNAPAVVVQNLVANIAPACSDCGTVSSTVDVRPGEDSCINSKSRGAIPAAFLGSADFDVASIRIDDNLKLGNLPVRRQGKKPQCALTDVNLDGFVDLLCSFTNEASAWLPGQTLVTLSGRLADGLPVSGSDTICVK